MTEPLSRVGVIGLGNMGMPMAANLVSAGYSVCGFDTDRDTLAAFEGLGGNRVESLEALAQHADAIILVLPNSAVVTDVLSDPGLRAALRPGVTLIDMSSSEPLATRALAGDLARMEVALVDAPVSGGVRGAAAGTLTIMVGGSDDEVARVSPLLGFLGSIVHVGPTGSGHAIKALNNLLSATHFWATSEAMTVGESFGLNPHTMLQVFNSSSGRSGSTEHKWPDFILPGSFNSGFALRLMLKDIRTATSLAVQLGVPGALSEQVAQHWAETAEMMPPDADHTEVARWLRQATVGEPHAGRGEELSPSELASGARVARRIVPRGQTK